MKVRELMSNSVSCVRENSSLFHAAGQMRRENIGSLPVCNDRGRLMGIITDRDIVIRGLSEDIPPALLSCGEIMTKNPVAISPDSDIHEAALIFASKKIRRLPVVEKNRLVGILSLGDIASKPVYIDEAGDALNAISINPAML